MKASSKHSDGSVESSDPWLSQAEYEHAVHSLRERVKELNCLYSISEIASRPELPLDVAIQAIVEVIPPAWQYPEVASASVSVGTQVYRSASYGPCDCPQAQPIRVAGVAVGSVEVGYLEPRPPADEGPFLSEERSLLNAIALRIGELVERRRAKEELDEENAKNRALIAAMPDLIFQIDSAGILLGFHSGSYRDVSPVLESLIGKSVAEDLDHNLLPRRTVEQGMGCVRHVLASGHPHAFEQHVFVAGQERDFEVRLVPATKTTVLGMVRDITERRRLEKEILEISGREQRRIGHDLHDGLCQHLTGIGFLTKALAKRLPPDQLGVVKDVQEIQRQVDETLTLTRRIARGLNPIQLETEGLLGGLADLAEQTTAVFGLPCTFEHRGEVPSRDATVALNLYRIAQEAINNAVKHARASRVEIRLEAVHGQTTLSVEDNGVGIMESSSHSAGMGFSIMRYRALAVGGTFTAQPLPQGGTVLICRVPATMAL